MEYYERIKNLRIDTDHSQKQIMVAYEMKKGTTKVVPKKIEIIDHSDPE